MDLGTPVPSPGTPRPHVPCQQKEPALGPRRYLTESATLTCASENCPHMLVHPAHHGLAPSTLSREWGKMLPLERKHIQARGGQSSGPHQRGQPFLASRGDVGQDALADLRAGPGPSQAFACSPHLPQEKLKPKVGVPGPQIDGVSSLSTRFQSSSVFPCMTGSCSLSCAHRGPKQQGVVGSKETRDRMEHQGRDPGNRIV